MKTIQKASDNQILAGVAVVALLVLAGLCWIVYENHREGGTWDRLMEPVSDERLKQIDRQNREIFLEYADRKVNPKRQR